MTLTQVSLASLPRFAHVYVRYSHGSARLVTPMLSSAIREHWRTFDAEAQLLARALRAGRLTVLVGALGVGKTTLLSAGVRPLLRRRVGDERQQPGGAPQGVVPIPDRRNRVQGSAQRERLYLRRPVERGAAGFAGAGARRRAAGPASPLRPRKGHVARAPVGPEPTARRRAPAVRIRPFRTAAQRRATQPRAAALRRSVGRCGAGARHRRRPLPRRRRRACLAPAACAWYQHSASRAARLPPAGTVRPPSAGIAGR